MDSRKHTFGAGEITMFDFSGNVIYVGRVEDLSLEVLTAQEELQPANLEELRRVMLPSGKPAKPTYLDNIRRTLQAEGDRYLIGFLNTGRWGSMTSGKSKQMKRLFRYLNRARR